MHNLRPQRPEAHHIGAAIGGQGKPAARKGNMEVITVTNDPVRLSFLASLLRDAGIEPILLDGHTSTMEGSIGALPRRLVVASDQAAQARRVLAEAGEV